MRVRPLLSLSSVLAILVPGAAPAPARTWQVPLEAATIQAGIDSAATGDTVVVACGIYHEHGINMKSGITLRGAGSTADCVVIDAQEQGRILDCVDLALPTRVAGMTFKAGKTEASFLDGLGAGMRCQNSVVAIADCAFRENSAQVGGGLGILESNVLVETCVFVANAATHPSWAGGGGIWCADCAPGLSGCVFSNNSAFSGDLPGDGGAIFCNNTDLYATDCVFASNSAGNGAGGFYSYNFDRSVLERCTFAANSANYGGAMYVEDSRTHVQSCTFLANTALSGGAIHIDRWSTPLISGSTFEANNATTFDGGAIACSQSSVVIQTCTIRGNIASSIGGGLSFVNHSDLHVMECGFYGNQAPEAGGAIWCQDHSLLALAASTLAGNSSHVGGSVFVGADAAGVCERTIIAFAGQGCALTAAGADSVVLSCCDLYGNAGGDWVGQIREQHGHDGNFAADPLFCNREEGDFTLNTSSPCLAGNHPDGIDCGLIGSLGAGCGLSDVELGLPGGLRLEQNHPNPFNLLTAIRYTLADQASVRIRIFDLSGRLVREIMASSWQAAGLHEVLWNGCDEAGRAMPSGVYLYEVTAGGFRAARCMDLVK